MPLFRSAVLNTYLKQQDSARMAAACAAFRAHFHKGDQKIRRSDDQMIRKLECA